MSALAGFTPVTEVAADDRARIAFGRVGVHGQDRFLVSTRETGEILLTPLASIPKRELDVWENEELLASVMRGAMQYAAGDLVERDDLDDE
ncbi:hypothetical protein BJY21_000089 [Kineosphaera limosa]|uniref:SpoVT-AbrB domain-containing protein n=1 Tax=Kineosphaera limosa NBRC 100340 TaxID=1184609 RepID=K6W6F0_9MICO|nr:hypothetical protein [Kineosphaera limosa]NYD98904.1 hypothetical protein [Kineosphaera limosa]GAB94770.1 hypothetical protein KILIM_011_00430 [Kineosphaera limosa NBRC 100340]